MFTQCTMACEQMVTNGNGSVRKHFAWGMYTYMTFDGMTWAFAQIQHGLGCALKVLEKFCKNSYMYL